MLVQDLPIRRRVAIAKSINGFVAGDAERTYRYTAIVLYGVKDFSGAAGHDGGTAPFSRREYRALRLSRGA